MRSRTRTQRTRGGVGSAAAALLCAPLLAAVGAPGAAHAAGATFYVDCHNGDDSSSGSEAAPFESVNQAIHEVNSDPDENTISVLSDSCDVGGPVPAITTSMTIEGNGNNTVLKADSSLSGSPLLTIDDSSSSDPIDVTVSDLTIDAVGSADTGISVDVSNGHVTIKDVGATNATNAGISVNTEGTAQVELADVTVEDNAHAGINLATTDNSHVSLDKVITKDNADQGIYSFMEKDSSLMINGVSATRNHSDGVLVATVDTSNATMSNVTATDNGASGIRALLADSAHTDITNSLATNNIGSGFRTVPLDESTISIANVAASGSGDSGFALLTSDSAAVSVSDVTANNNQENGIKIRSYDNSSVMIDHTGSNANTLNGVTVESGSQNSHVTMTDNQIENDGTNGIAVTELYGTVAVDRSTVGHSGGDGINISSTAENSPAADSVGHMTIARSTIAEDSGDGIDISAETPATVDVTNSTLAHHPDGAQITTTGQASDVDLNVTFSTLSAAGSPGEAALTTNAATTVTHSILDNGGSPAITLVDGASLAVDHTLVRHVDAGSAVEAALSNGTGNIVNADPKHGPLADNGGPTQTLLPALTSPVVDAGLEASDFTSPPSTDQRGEPRFGSPADLGAVELVHETVTATPADPTVTQAVCDGDEATTPTVELPDDSEQLSYSLDGDVAAGQTVTVTATANDHVTITVDDSDWTVNDEGTSATLEISLDAAPGCAPDDSGDDQTPPSDGDQTPGDGEAPPADNGNETPGDGDDGQTPGDGGQTPGDGDQSSPGDDSEPTAPTGPESATPESPTVVQPTCREGEPYGPQIDLASTRGLTYNLDGSLDPGTTATVTVTPADDYTIDATDADGWSTSDDGTATLTVTIDDPHCDTAAAPAPTDDGTDELADTGSTVPPWGGADLAALLMLLGALGLVRARQVRKARG